VTKQRPLQRFSVLAYALAAFRFATACALLLVLLLVLLLIVELGQPSVPVPEQTYPLPAIRSSHRHDPEASVVVFLEGGSLGQPRYSPELTLDGNNA